MLMANDNKKINDLVSESDDDTSELEVLSEDALNETDVEFEADAATYAFENLSRDRGADNDSIAALRSELRERDSNIDRLEYELQQFRARAKGLEKELEAREALTSNLAGELELQKRSAGEIHEQLRARQQRLEELQQQLEARDERIGDAARELESARKNANSATTAYEDLEKRHAALARELDSVRSQLAEEQGRRKWAEDSERTLGDKVAAFEERDRESNELIASMRDYIEGRKARWEQQEFGLKAREQSLREQQKSIERLTKDVRYSTERLDREKTGREQAEVRLVALEQEAADLRTTIGQRNAASAEKDATVASLTAEIDELRQQFAKTSSALQQAEEQRNDACAVLERERAETASLREEVTSIRASAGEREAALKERQEAIQTLENRISGSESELREERANRHDLKKRFEAEQAVRRKLDADRESLVAEARQLRADVRELRAAAIDYAELEKSQSQLVGQVASQEMALEELRQQLARTEGYADTLRDKLQRQIAAAEGQASRAHRLEQDLAGASARIEQLAAGLEGEKQQTSGLAAELEKARREFEDEVRTIRFELDEAQETIAESKNINQQLTADLVDSTGRRRTLEAKLSESGEQHRSARQRLTDEVARLKLQLEDYEQKLAHKDAAVKALLAEFASKSKDRTKAGEHAAGDRDAQEVVHRLPGRKIAGDDGGNDRDRVTRLLVGTISGQKLRFPLFKDKLTIGRTAHNDIQIKAQYISRRHAVVVTEDERTRIVDWGSKNGVYVNGIRVTEKVLRNGDLVTVGTAEFVFEERLKR